MDPVAIITPLRAIRMLLGGTGVLVRAERWKEIEEAMARWNDLRLTQAAEVAAEHGCASAVDVESLVAEVRRLKRLLDRAYPWLHNPYTPRLDARLCAQFGEMKREIEVVISHLPEVDEDNERVALPCGSCDGDGCPNCAIDAILRADQRVEG